MNSFLLNRELASIRPAVFVQAQHDRLLAALQHAPDVIFTAPPRQPDRVRGRDPGRNLAAGLAHAAGVNSIAVDRFEGRYLISGGADSSLAIWDLDQDRDPGEKQQQQPLAQTTKTAVTASLGINHVSFFPFDSLALLTSGYDHTLKLIASETLAVSATLDLGAIVYSHATSDVAPHLLVACASQHPAVRLVDLRSGAATHSLAGHAGSVLSVAWHPREEHILASGATDGAIRLWDVRRSASSLGVLDMDDSSGVVTGGAARSRPRESGRAHRGAVNGLAWTPDGRHIVSTGHDERMRVWHMGTGANTLADFGPGLKNAAVTALLPLVVPSAQSPVGTHVVFYPNPREILGFDLHSGACRNRLRVTASAALAAPDDARLPKNRTMSLAWRAHHVEMYSGHGDGTIRCWRPWTSDDQVAEEDVDEHAGSANERKRKREALEQIVQDLTKKSVTFI
jgi:DNA excision repair protein ERCC-8